MAQPTFDKTHFVVRPTRTTVFFRTFLPWQLLRFLVVNLRMTLMIMKSHGGKPTRRKG